MTTEMTAEVNAGEARDHASVVLGYLNFSSGAFDPAAWRALDALFAELEPAGPDGAVRERPDAARAVAAQLDRRLAELSGGSAAFRDTAQARAALGLVFDRGLAAYRRFHADLLEHQPPGAIERPWFVMAVAQAVLAESAATDGLGDDAIVARAVDRLNDYVGWRPVAVLENGRLSEPYGHERVRPVPLFVSTAGVAHGRYRDLVATALEILAAAPPQLLRQADFDPDALDELAIDPRAFDFLHPAASRPNYLFGLWDPGRIDRHGRYRRMVVQQATLDGILSWPEQAADDRDPERRAELRREAAAVLAGVVLMAAGLSGHGPGAHHAALPLADLLPRIAGYRDEFYRWLLGTLPSRHRTRLEEEAARQRQPFGGVRRHINATLAGRRARQVESVALAAVWARLGRADAADRLAGAVPAASARLFARLTSRVVAAQGAVRRGPEGAAAALAELDEATAVLFRAVECGAAVDPWNVLGLSGQFPLHEPGGESLPDPRVDDLVHAVDSILSGYAAVQRLAALAGARDAAARAAGAVERLAAWWDRFATTTVSGVPQLSGREISASVAEVIAALERRRASAPAAPPLGFWRREVASFSTPRSHAQAAETLVGEGDLDGAMGLLVHWASLLEGDAIGTTGPMWLAAAKRWVDLAAALPGPEPRARVRRFLELVEANTSAIVDVIEAAAGGGPASTGRGDDADDEPPGGEESVAAAYESMVWRDSTDDGVEDGMLDVDLPGGGGPGGPAAVEDAAELLAGTFALVRSAVISWCAADAAAGVAADAAEIDSVVGWRHSLRRLRRTLVRAAAAVAAGDREPAPGTSPVEFDRLRWQRDAAAERLLDAAVQAGETSWILSARLHVGRRPAGRDPSRGGAGRLFAALFAGDAAAATRELDGLRERLTGKPVLYVPLSRGGRPDRIVRARGRARLLARVAACLPRVGLVSEAIGVVQLAKSLESLRPPGAASVSEFDRVFEAAAAALVERIVESAGGDSADDEIATGRILDGLALLVPRLLETWLTHARQLRLSVLERVRDEKAFALTREFVERYGAGLFTQQLLGPGALRGVLRRGVREWLEQLVDDGIDGPDAGPGQAVAPRRPTRLIEDLASGAIGYRQAASRVRLVLEAVAENHAEYRDWNSTTTQSDRGECLHILLEFLLVKAEYDRIAWTLKPVNVAHRALARRGATRAAEAWRGRMRDETRGTAAALVERLARLEAHWGFGLASVGDRVRRPFTSALEQDELEALVEPAVRELFAAGPGAAGARLEARAAAFLGVASGSGVEVPEWLERLSNAVDRELDRAAAGGFDPDSRADRCRLPDAVPWARMPWETLHAALRS